MSNNNKNGIPLQDMGKNTTAIKNAPVVGKSSEYRNSTLSGRACANLQRKIKKFEENSGLFSFIFRYILPTGFLIMIIFVCMQIMKTTDQCTALPKDETCKDVCTSDKLCGDKCRKCKMNEQYHSPCTDIGTGIFIGTTQSVVGIASGLLFVFCLFTIGNALYHYKDWSGEKSRNLAFAVIMGAGSGYILIDQYFIKLLGSGEYTSVINQQELFQKGINDYLTGCGFDPNKKGKVEEESTDEK